MTTVNPTHQLFWFASRAFGIVAIVMLGISVAVGLTMSGRLMRRPGMNAKLRRFHEASTLVTLGLIVAHGGLLLFDTYLRPGLAGITLPFAIGYRPAVHRARDHRRLARSDSRAELLRPPADRRQDVAQAPPLHDRRLPTRARARRRRRHQRHQPMDAGAADRAHRADRVRVHLPHAPRYAKAGAADADD